MRAAGLAASAAVAAAALGAHAVDVSQEGFMFSGYGCDRSCDQGDVNYEIEYVGGGARQRLKAACLPRVCPTISLVLSLSRAVSLSGLWHGLWLLFTHCHARTIQFAGMLRHRHVPVWCSLGLESRPGRLARAELETTRLYDARVGYYTVRMLTAHPCTSRTRAAAAGWAGAPATAPPPRCACPLAHMIQQSSS